jgi:glucokinase
MPFDIGVDIGGTNIKVGVVDGKGRVVARRLLPTKAKAGPIPAMERVADTAAALRKRRKVRSLGVGLPGLVDHVHGIVRVPPNLPGWNGTPIKEILERLTGLPVACANDVNAMTMGEWVFGAGKGCRDLVCVTLGTGVGGGIISDGRLLLGANHAAGEVGHTVIVHNGLPCLCGSRGCLERYIGAAYFVDRARKRVRAQLKRLKDHRNQTALFGGMKHDGPSEILELAGGDYGRITPREIGKAARSGDKLALELVTEFGDFLGTGLANAVQLVDPERIVIGGGVSRMGAPLMRAVRKAVYCRVPAFPGRKLDIVLAALGNDAGVVGASQLARAMTGGTGSGPSSIPD